jgi:tetratricopeptide (TPR) repeat protein
MANALPSTFGDLLRRHRRAAGLTHAQLAERAGLSIRAISDLERGINRRPRQDTLRLLAEALGLSPAERAALLAALHQPAALAPPAAPAPDAGAPPLVGRAHELELIARHLARQGPATILFLAGEPGIGKSRLLAEATQRATASGWSVLAGGCHRRSGQEPYAPLLAALAHALAALAPAQRRAALRGCAWLVKLLPELAAETEPLPGWPLPPEQERRLLFGAVGRLLANLAGTAGTLLLLDDLHWAGPDALDLLVALVRAPGFAASPAAPTPLCLIGAYRDTELTAHSALAVLVTDLAREGRAARLSLGPLPARDAAELLGALLGAEAAEDAALRAQVLARAGGVPYFLVSCAHGVRAGVLRGNEQQGDIPWDVAASIHQRVAALSPAAQDLLGAAAVVGQHAARSLLSTVAQQPGREEAEVLAALDVACEARLLAEEGDGYVFTHDLVREVVMAYLGSARRTALHRRIAEAIERGPGEPPAELLAYHYGRADVAEKAVVYLERAGDRAQAIHAYAEAEDYYRQLVERLDALGRAVDAAGACEKLAALLITRVRYAEALDVLERAVETYRTAGDSEAQARTLAQIGLAHASRGTPHEGLARLQPALRRFEAGGASPGLVALYAALADLYFRSGRYAEQLTAADRAAELAQMIGDAHLLAVAQGKRGIGLYHLGRLDETIAALAETIRLAEATGDLRTLSRALNNIAAPYHARGEIAQSLPYITRALAVAERMGDPAWTAFLTDRCGEIRFSLGQWDEAHLDYERAVAMMRELGASWESAYPLLLLGQLLLARGEWEAGAASLDEAIARAQQSDDLQALRMAQSALAERDLVEGHPAAALERLAPLLDRPGQREMYATMLLPLLAWAHLEQDEPAQAEPLLAQAVARATAAGFRWALVDALRVRGMLATRRRQWQQAEAALAEALDLARAMGYPYGALKALYASGLLHAQMGQPAPARERFEQALTICTRLGERLYATHIEQALAGLESQ